MKYIRSSKPWFNDSENTGEALNAVGMRRDMTMNDFRRIVEMDGAYYWRAIAVYRLKCAVKSLFGRLS
jgi:hypothetical protein